MIQEYICCYFGWISGPSFIMYIGCLVYEGGGCSDGACTYCEERGKRDGYFDRSHGRTIDGNTQPPLPMAKCTYGNYVHHCKHCKHYNYSNNIININVTTKILML